VNITSVHEHTPNLRSVAYNAAKHALGGLTKSMAIDLAQYGIRVCAVAPGMITTAQNNMEGVNPHDIKRPRLPLGRPGGPEEVASLVAWICSDEASYVTGTSWAVDGGFLITNPQFGGQGLDE